MNRTELLAPGGSFESALAALENGADAVYCGLPNFSARKAAKNLNASELSRLRQWTSERGRKIYLALNTILKEEDLSPVLDALFLADNLGLDALILQDPGLAKLARDHFPNLELHASTQAAVHNSWGIRALQAAGFSRVVLPRELTIKEVEALHRQNPQMELEVFIHGAQCYGFSGMCLASGLLLGRSGNRGGCGQICRTWFRHSEEEGYYFSCNDLYAGKDVLPLAEAGAVSLKIEGRMKSPAYAAAVTKLYRHILDRKDPAEIPALEEDARVAFSRQPGKGHLFSAKGERMINPAYPGHLGVPAGKVASRRGNRLYMDAAVPLASRDGLMFFRKGEPRTFSLRLADGRSSAPPGPVSFFAPEKNAPAPGEALYKVQAHDHHWKEENPEKFPAYERKAEAEVRFGASELTLHVPSWGFSHSFPIETEAAKDPLRSAQKLKDELGRSGDYPFVLSPVVYPEAALRGEGLFLPPSRIKKIRQEIYRRLKAHREEQRREEKDRILKDLDRQWAAFMREKGSFRLPPREEWGPQGNDLPYLTEGALKEGLPFLPLSPLLLPGKDESYRKALEPLAENAGSAGAFGVNNWGHLELLRSLFRGEGKPCVLDVGMLIANRAAVLLMDELLPGPLIGCYGWVEASPAELPEALTPVAAPERLPLFISRNCFRKHSLGRSCRGCPTSGRYTLAQRKNSYDVIVEDCLTWVFQSRQPPPESVPRN